MKKKKILFLATHAYTLFNPKEKTPHGGSEVQLVSIAKELAKNDKLNLTFVVGDFGQKRKECYNKINVIKSFNPKSKGASVAKKAIQSLKYFLLLAKENPSICITSSANSTVGVVGLYCTLFRKKHIHRCANIIDVNGIWIKNNGVLGKVYKYGLEHADIVLCQTNDQLKAIKENHNREDAILYKNIFDFSQEKEIKKEDYILWVGRAHDSKKPEKFLELVKKNPKLKFVMICNNQSKELYEKIETQANELKNLTFIEKIPFHEIQQYYDNAIAFVSTSDFEGFANTFIQSGLGKTPILTLNSNPDQFITKYNCGLFANGSEQKLNENLNTIINNKKLQEQMGENAYNYVKANYDVKDNIKIIEKLVN